MKKLEDRKPSTERERVNAIGTAASRLRKYGLQALQNAPAGETKKTRRDRLIADVVKCEKITKISAEKLVNEVIDVYDEYFLVRDRVIASYARDIKFDSYGKPDTRKVKQSIYRALRQEGILPEYGSHAGHPTVSWCIHFAEQETSDRQAAFRNNYDKGIDFELVCLTSLLSVSTDARRTSEGADFGADILFTYKNVFCAAQCKSLSKPAGVRAVQEIAAACQHYRATQGVVFCDSGFSDAAEQLAVGNRIVLVTGADMSSLDRQVTTLAQPT